MRIPFVDLQAQFAEIRGDVLKNLTSAMETAGFILGREVAEFEDAFAEYCGCRYAVGVNSGLDALRLSLKAMGIGPGDEVIIPANTFIACALAVSYLGGRPVLVEPEEGYYTIDVGRIEAAITPRTKAIMPVHFYGQPADMEPLLELARRHRLLVIEDGSQAHGARCRGRRVGGLGDIAAFSLYPGKNLGAYGDGGIVTTNNAAWAEQLRLLRNYGSPRKYYHEVCGENTRLDTLQAAVLLAKLPRLDRWNARRRAAAARYTRNLQGVGDLVLPQVRPDCEHVFHLFVVRSRRRDALAAFLQQRGVTIIIHYPVPIHQQRAFRETGGWRTGDFPLTERLCAEILSLPMYPEIAPEQIDYVTDTIRAFYKEPQL
jgi:dTDP-4-amino-4,6-dideoxygalactose transaminase